MSLLSSLNNPANKPYLEEFDGFVSYLRHRGFKIRHYSGAPNDLDSFVVDFTNGDLTFIIMRDRSRFILIGEEKELEPHGLWKAFDNLGEFQERLFEWLESSPRQDFGQYRL